MTSLYLIPIIVTIAVAFSRVIATRGATVEGRIQHEFALTFTERMRYHRFSIYSLGFLLLLGAMSGVVHVTVEVVAIAAMFGVLTRQVHYRITGAGIALNRVVFRQWSEFDRFEATRSSVRLLGKPGFGRFDIRVTGARQAAVMRMLSGRVRGTAAPIIEAHSLGRRLNRTMLIVPVLAAVLLVGIGAGTALAQTPEDEGPSIDAGGTTVGAPEDLAGIGVGGGSLAVLDADGAFDADATAKCLQRRRRTSRSPTTSRRTSTRTASPSTSSGCSSPASW